MAIVKPENMDFSNKNIIMIISGLPGVGKTSLALSAPDVVLIDADEGLARVKPEHRKDASMCKTYEELLEDVKAFAGRYKTVVVDTGGSLIDMLKDWAGRTDKSVYTSKGNIDTRKVFGVVKSEFLRFSYELRQSFNVIYLFHVVKEKTSDGTDWYEIICEGSAKTLVWQPADLGAYMHVINGERYLGFTPTMNYNAKAAYGIKGLIKVPELKDGDPNDFLTKLFAQVQANLAAEHEALKPQQEAYDKAMADGKAIIDGVDSPEKALPALNDIRALPHALTSQKELEAAFKTKVKELGYTYSKQDQAYVAKAE